MDEFLDFGDYPVIYADDVAEIQPVTGGNRRILFSSWHKIDGVFRRKVVAAVIQPAANILASFDLFAASCRAQESHGLLQ